MNPCNYVWRHREEFKNQNFDLTLRGHSVSARESGFIVDRWKIALDAGIAFNTQVDHIFITHSHSDHALQLPSILTGSQNTPIIYVMRGTSHLYKSLLLAKQRMTKNNCELSWSDISSKCKFVECDPHSTFEIVVNKNRILQVDILETDHTIPSIGFAFSEKRCKLKSEFHRFEGKELAKMKKDGVEIKEYYFAPLLIYVGDSTPAWFDLNKELIDRQFAFIICECTFIEELEPPEKLEAFQLSRAKQSASRHGHTCWSDLKVSIEAQNAGKLKKTSFILVHWSKRYEPYEKLKIICSQENIIPWTW